MSSYGDKVLDAAYLDGGSRSWVLTKDENQVLRLNGGYTMQLSGITRVDDLPEGTYKLYFVVKLEKPEDPVWKNWPVTFQLGAGRARADNPNKDIKLADQIKDTHYHKVPEEGLEFNRSEHRYVTFFMFEITSDKWKEGLLVKEVRLERQK